MNKFRKTILSIGFWFSIVCLVASAVLFILYNVCDTIAQMAMFGYIVSFITVLYPWTNKLFIAGLATGVSGLALLFIVTSIVISTSKNKNGK